eukprot:g43251.t1
MVGAKLLYASASWDLPGANKLSKLEGALVAPLRVILGVDYQDCWRAVATSGLKEIPKLIQQTTLFLLASRGRIREWHTALNSVFICADDVMQELSL